MAFIASLILGCTKYQEYCRFGRHAPYVNLPETRPCTVSEDACMYAIVDLRYTGLIVMHMRNTFSISEESLNLRVIVHIHQWEARVCQITVE